MVYSYYRVGNHPHSGGLLILVITNPFIKNQSGAGPSRRPTAAAPLCRNHTGSTHAQCSTSLGEKASSSSLVDPSCAHARCSLRATAQRVKTQTQPCLNAVPPSPNPSRGAVREYVHHTASQLSIAGSYMTYDCQEVPVTTRRTLEPTHVGRRQNDKSYRTPSYQDN